MIVYQLLVMDVVHFRNKRK